MSTSPSWFDQEKFSRLVKKVGAKTAAGTPAATAAPPTSRAPKETKRILPAQAPSTPTPSAALAPSVKASQPIQRAPSAPPPPSVSDPEPAAAPETAEPPPVGRPSSSEESLPGFPVALPPPEPRSVSPLSKRTTPLPDLNRLFEYEKPVSRDQIPALEEREVETVGPKQTDSKTEAPETISDMPVESVPAGETSAFPTEEEEEQDEPAAGGDELSRITQERDDPRHEADLLREGAETSEKSGNESGSDELLRAIEDRDSARRDYAGLREQFETLKQEQVRLRTEPARKDPGLQQEVESLRRQLAEREEELNALKLDPVGNDPEIDSLREEADVLQQQLNQAREEASIAQRGLALSQKALQETRDALREATEGSSQTKSSFESLKNECATLVQQNMLLQAQHDQLSRELAALKAKNSTKTLPSL